MKPKFSEIFFYQRSLSRSRKGRSLFLFAHSDIYLQLCIWNDYLILLIASNYQILLDGPYHLRELALDWLFITQVVDLNAHHSDITKEPTKCASHLQTFCPRYFVSCISFFYIFKDGLGTKFKNLIKNQFPLSNAAGWNLWLASC